MTLAEVAPVGGILNARVTATDDAGNESNVTAVYRVLDSTIPWSKFFPAAGETNAALWPLVVATFSEELDTNSVTAATFTVSDAGTPVPGQFSFRQTNQVVQWGVVGPLVPGREYAVSLGAGITDTNANSIVPYTSTFTVSSFGITSPHEWGRVVEGQRLIVRAGGGNPAAVRMMNYTTSSGVRWARMLILRRSSWCPVCQRFRAANSRFRHCETCREESGEGCICAGLVGRIGGSVSRIIDGNRSGNWADGSVAHTGNGNELHPWFELDLGQVTSFQQTALYFRTDSSPEQSSVAILVSGAAVCCLGFLRRGSSSGLLQRCRRVVPGDQRIPAGECGGNAGCVCRYVRVVHLGRVFCRWRKLSFATVRRWPLSLRLFPVLPNTPGLRTNGLSTEIPSTFSHTDLDLHGFWNWIWER